MGLSSLFPKIQNLFYNWCHIVVTILGETTTENNVGLLCGELAVLVGKRIVAVVVDGIVGFHSFLIFRAVFFTDNGLGTFIDFLSEHLEMLMLDDAGVGLIMTGIVDNGISLIVGRIFNAGLKADGTPVEFTVAKVKILINRPAIYYFRRFKLQVTGFKFP